MTDRRFVLVLVGLLVALVGVTGVVLSGIALTDPVQVTGEGEQVDYTRVLAAGVALGVLLLVAGVSTAVHLVRAQLRSNR